MSPLVTIGRYYSQVMNQIKRIEESISLKKVINIAIIEPSKEDRAVLETRLRRAFRSRINLILVPYLDFYISQEVDLYIIIDREILRKAHNWKVLWERFERRTSKILFVSYSPHLDLPKGMKIDQVDIAYEAREIIKYVSKYKQSLNHK